MTMNRRSMINWVVGLTAAGATVPFMPSLLPETNYVVGVDWSSQSSEAVFAVVYNGIVTLEDGHNYRVDYGKLRRLMRSQSPQPKPNGFGSHK